MTDGDRWRYTLDLIVPFDADPRELLGRVAFNLRDHGASLLEIRGEALDEPR